MQEKKQSFQEYLAGLKSSFSEKVPSASKTHAFVDGLINLVFPFRTENNMDSGQVRQRLAGLEKELEELLGSLGSRLDESPAKICSRFMEQMPGVCEKLVRDAAAFAEFDPASDSKEEIILCYPGFYSISVYRIANLLWDMQVPILPRIMTEYAHSRTGVDIHPGAMIGESFFIDHGTGTVIGETAIIGNNVKIYQGVTLGALFVRKDLARQKRHPTIEDNVIVYARSTILGGDTIIGHDSVIGGNVWLTDSVHPNSVVYQKHHVVVRDSKKNDEQINWVI